SRVYELRVLQHLKSRLGARVPEVRAEDEIARCRLMRRQSVAIDSGGKVLAPGFRLADAAKDGVDLNALNRFVGNVLELQRDAGNELVLAVLNPRVVPTRVNVSNLEDFLDVELMAAAREEQSCGYCKNNTPHRAIVMRSEWLHLDVRARVLEGHSSGAKRSQVRALDAEDDTADARGVAGNAPGGPYVVTRGDRQPFVVAYGQRPAVFDHRIDDGRADFMGVRRVWIVNDGAIERRCRRRQRDRLSAHRRSR